MMLFLIVLAGALLGSFLNMLIYRLPRQEDIVWKPSHCPQCGHRLGVVSLMPILSFLIQKGRCRYCSQKIPSRYLLCELSTVALAVACFMQFSLSFLFFKTLIFGSIMIALWYIDWEQYLLPDSLTLPLIVLGLGLGFYGHRGMDSVWGACVGFGLFFLIGKLSKLYYKKEAMGAGDVKLAAAIGAYWGLKVVLITSYLSFILGGIVGVFLLATGIKKKQDYIPFGPALIGGCVLALIWGDILCHFILR